jgi:hypothetical protein
VALGGRGSAKKPLPQRGNMTVEDIRARYFGGPAPAPALPQAGVCVCVCVCVCTLQTRWRLSRVRPTRHGA